MTIHVHGVTHCKTFIILKYWKQPKHPHIGEWLNKLGYIHNRVQVERGTVKECPLGHM